MSFPAGRHFFVENGVLMLTVARAILKDGSEGILETESAEPWDHR